MIEQCSEEERWDSGVLERAGHPLQLWGWGEIKARGNWRVERVICKENGQIVGLAQLLLRPLPGPFKCLAYVPRGPVAALSNREEVLKSLAEYAKDTFGAVSLLVEPDWDDMPPLTNWRKAPNPILLARTIILDLKKTDDELLADMTKKTRQYIRKSEKSGVEVRFAKTTEDIAGCLKIYKQTAKRAGFALHDDGYYEAIFDKLGSNSQVLMAMHQGRVVAFLWLVVSSETAFELYGGMNDEGQELRANYILKWTAIQKTKEWGIGRYDMNGLLNDGVSQFKQGFSNHETHLAGSYELPLSPLYGIWAKGLPTAKKIVRRIRK